MAKFHPVPPGSVNKQLVALGPETAIIYSYIQSTIHRNSEGLFRCPPAYVSADLGFTPAQVEEAFAQLQKSGRILYDRDAEVILDPNALHVLAPKSPTQLKGAITKLRQLPKTPLLEELWKRAFAYAPDLAEAMQEAFPGVDSLSEESRDTIETHTQTDSIPRVRDRQLRGGGGVDAVVERLKKKFNAEEVSEEELAALRGGRA